ncbi:MAG: hypothetical protein GY771_02505 [bacterium]|nr:hypothetical protein [bacterium]
MSVGERKYPHPLIALVAVLVAALAMSAIIWAGSGWPWRSDVIGEEEGTEEAKTSSYVEFYGVRTVLPHSEYGGVAAANPFTFAITPRYLVFPNGERFRYEIKSGKITAWDGLPLEALKRLNPGGGRASLYIDEYTPMVLLYHLLPQFLEAGFSGYDFILNGPEGETEWQTYTDADLYSEGYNPGFLCLYWDRRVLQWGTADRVIREIPTTEYLFLSWNEFERVVGNEAGPVILLPGANTTFGELVAARDVVRESGEPRPLLTTGLNDPAVEPFIDVLAINPGIWVYDIQPTEDNPPAYYIK